MAFRLLFAAGLFSISAAFFWTRPNTVATSDDRPVDDECLALADEGSCEFYACFERRLPCGRDWYMMRTGHHYCNVMVRDKERFTAAGRTFLEDAQRCLTRSLKELYQRDYISCHDLEHQAVEAIPTCFVDNAFCDIMAENSDRNLFFQIYDTADLFSRGAAKVWRAILRIFMDCSAESLREFAADGTDGFVESVNGFFDAMANMGDRFVDRLELDK